MLIDQQWHGYRRGHQLLASTLELSARDQDLVDKLSDASGTPRPGERFEPYFTVYPLPSGEYNVVARTWQDLKAPRSGTVFTRSLLIRSAVWRSLPNIRPVFSTLESQEITSGPTALIEEDMPWPAIAEPALAPLVEAVFLERVIAVAAFGFQNADTIAGRLLEALWPGRRANFAVCTHVMGPRSLPDRDFDLVFAPEVSRSRFAKWDGRKISASHASAPARHDWTDQIQKRIFDAHHPSLQELDEIGALNDARSDESALRLALKWSELQGKAESTPNALLAMLDILSSLGRSPWTVPSLETLMAASLTNVGQDPTPQTWQFLQLLIRKLGDKIPLGVLRPIFSATQQVAHQAPAVVVGGNDLASAPSIPHVLRPAVAQGLSQLDVRALASVLDTLEPTLGVSLMAESPEFAEAITTTLSAVPNDRLVAELATIAANDRRAARRLAAGVSKGSRASSIAPLLKIALNASPRGNFKGLAANVMAASGASRDAVLDTLVEVSCLFLQEQNLRELALKTSVASEGDRLLRGLIHDRISATWLIDKLLDHPGRLHPLLLSLMKGWTDQELLAVMAEGRNRDALFEASLIELPKSGKAFTRLLRMDEMAATKAVALLRQAAPRLASSDLKEASLAILAQLVSLDPENNADLLEPILSWIDPTTLVNAATSTALNGVQVGQNVAAIARSKSNVRFIPFIDLLTRRLVERRSGGYGASGYDGWAYLLRTARQTHPEALVRSADAALDYALARSGEPAGALVAAAFPVVHARLKKESLPDIPFNLITAALMLPLTLFTDWDRSKAARHGLVDAFLRSKWDPVELLRAAIDADISRKVLGYLASKPGGRNYIRRIEAGVRTQPDMTRKRLSKALDDFRSNGS